MAYTTFSVEFIYGGWRLIHLIFIFHNLLYSVKPPVKIFVTKAENKMAFNKFNIPASGQMIPSQNQGKQGSLFLGILDWAGADVSRPNSVLAKRCYISSFSNLALRFGKISAQPHPTLCIQCLNRENNDKNNTFPLGKQICFTMVWGCAETLPTWKRPCILWCMVMQTVRLVLCACIVWLKREHKRYIQCSSLF